MIAFCQQYIGEHNRGKEETTKHPSSTACSFFKTRDNGTVPLVGLGVGFYRRCCVVPVVSGGTSGSVRC